MKREKFLELLSRKCSGEISVTEREMLDLVVENNEEYSLLAIKLEQYFNAQKHSSPKTAQLNHIWESITAAEVEGFKENFDYLAHKKTGFIPGYFFKIAAAFLVILGAGLLGYHLLYPQTNPGFYKVATTNQKMFKLLDDGTKIWLNKKSSIRYNKAFGKHKREIILEGEAYFDVVKNKEIPLFIHAGTIDIEVKGTAFNVKAYKENSEIQVALVRGAVQVTDRLNTRHRVLLRPNEKLIFSNPVFSGNKNGFIVLALAETLLLKDTGWKADTLLFNKEKLKDLIIRMEKKYDIKIDIQSEQLKERRFSGAFTDETIQQALEALKLSYPLTYTIGNRLVVIKD